MGPKNSEVNFCSFLYLQKQNHQAIGSGFSQKQSQIKGGLLHTASEEIQKVHLISGL